MKLYRITGQLLLAMLVLLLGGLANGAEVVLYPGHITGSVTTALSGYEAKNIYVTASGGGYYASNNTISSDNYSLTVQTGDWNTQVSVSATLAPAGATSPSNTLSFSPRTIAVNQGATVINNYYAGGVVRFHVTITGDDYNSWNGHGSAYKQESTVNERTNSGSNTGNNSADGSFVMAVVPNDQIGISAEIRVQSTYGTKEYSFPFLMNVADGQVVDVDLHIDHVAPPQPEPKPQPIPQPGPIVDYGTVDVTTSLDLNIDGLNYNSYFFNMPVSCYSGGSYKSGYTAQNPGHLVLSNAKVGDGFCTPAWVRFKSNPVNPKDGFNVLYMPGGFLGGATLLGEKITVLKDQTTYVDIPRETGIGTGRLRFTGAATNAEMTSVGMVFNGSQEIYDPVYGWMFQPTYGGYTEFHQGGINGSGIFSKFLTGGFWDTSSVYTNSINYTRGYLFRTDMSIKDYKYMYDGNDYDFGQSLYIAPGQTTYHEREYCLGKAIIPFRTQGGGLLSNPVVNANGTKMTADGRIEMYARLYAVSQANRIETPEVELYGPPMNYTMTGIQVRAEDGSQISFTNRPLTLECGVTKVVPVPGPVLTVTAPAAGIISNAVAETVTGITGGELAISLITVNGTESPFSSTANPDDANEVAFAYELPLADGVNTILTKAVDANNIVASDQREIMVDRWVPTVSLVEPIDNTLLSPGMPVNLVVSSSDRGYGFNLKVYVDGVLLKRTSHTPTNDTTWDAVNYQTVMIVSSTEQVVLLEATDLAGNSSTLTFTVGCNESPVAAAGPDQIVEQASLAGADVSLDGSGSSDPDGDPITCSWTGDFGNLTGCSVTVSLPLGDHAITLNVSDGLLATNDDLLVRVMDTTPPSITAPADVSAEQAHRDGTAVEIGTAQATDISDAAPVITNNAPAVFPFGSTIVTWTATDASGNMALANQVITVVDTTPPSLTVPADVSAEQAYRDGTAVDIGTAQATDISDASPVITNNAPAVFPFGSTIVTWKATDASGNTTSTTQMVTMVDTTPPVGTMSVTPELLWPPDHKYVQVTPSLLVSDICDAEIDIVLDSITMNEGEDTNTYYSEVDGTFGDGNTVQDIYVENGLIYLRAERSGQGAGRIYSIKFRLIDDSGNVGSTEATVTVPHSL